MPVDDSEPLQAVEPNYRHVLRLRMAITWTLFAAAALTLDLTLIRRTEFGGILPIVVLLIGLAVVTVGPPRIYRRLKYRLTERQLQVLRGWLFHVDTVVPLVRVQHIDVTRGPLDKLFGTASLVVHTAGTHNSIVGLPGLSPERAAEIRDIIREHVRTDYA